MRPGIPIFVKKRGARRTGARWWGPLGEGIFYAVFLLVGGAGLAWLIVAVLIPEVRRNAAVEQFVAAPATVVDKRIESAPTTDGFKYRPQILIEIEVGGQRQPPVWTYDAVSGFTLDRDEAEAAVARFDTGKTYRCWYDPADPTRAVLVRQSRWWPWLVTIIPISLIAYGVVGLVALLWQTMTSTELRSAVAKRAASVHDPVRPNVPVIDQVIDSPGVRMAYRLPADASPSWLLLGMVVISLFWNLLVGVFVVQVIELHRVGRPNWLLTWLMVPFVLAGGWIIYQVVRQIIVSSGLGTTRVEIDEHPLRPGRTYQAFVSQTGRIHMRWYQVLLVSEESATFQQGTDTRIETRRVYRCLLHRVRKFDIQAGTPYETQIEFTLPSAAMHSFSAPRNQIQWALVVRGKVSRWPLFERRFPIYVYPVEPRASRLERPVDVVGDWH